jgi:hypothetical protein
MDSPQPLEVIARFAPDGKVTPLRFRWRGSLYTVESTGRRWQAEDGCHILVLAAGGQMFELLFTAPDNRWYLAQAKSAPMAI